MFFVSLFRMGFTFRGTAKRLANQGTPSVVSFNSAITACERASAWNIGLHLLQVGVMTWISDGVMDL